MPYPRWIRTAPIGKPIAIDFGILRNRVPRRNDPSRWASARSTGKSWSPAAAPAQHSIETARRFAAAQGARHRPQPDSSLDLCDAQDPCAWLDQYRILGTPIPLSWGDSIGRSFDIIEASWRGCTICADPADRLARPAGPTALARRNSTNCSGLYSAPLRAPTSAPRAPSSLERGYQQKRRRHLQPPPGHEAGRAEE